MDPSIDKHHIKHFVSLIRMNFEMIPIFFFLDWVRVNEHENHTKEPNMI